MNTYCTNEVSSIVHFERTSYSGNMRTELCVCCLPTTPETRNSRRRVAFVYKQPTPSASARPTDRPEQLSRQLRHGRTTPPTNTPMMSDCSGEGASPLPRLPGFPLPRPECRGCETQLPENRRQHCAGRPRDPTRSGGIFVPLARPRGTRWVPQRVSPPRCVSSTAELSTR